ncbi:uncharacterized protein LOC125834617 [Solanum verrucosum]|uniref:uncharacterized protein LOC125834617 n=1 Tax=Solanum verrucosum TaxID=315347 RepID=UPI0020D0F6A8|nr:uncharacterized protein LOC125834617 [Solanum verrucosum]
MTRACVLDFKGRDDYQPLIEFAYNNRYHRSIKMAPYEALYGRKCRSPIGWFETGETALFGPGLVHQTMENVKVSPMKDVMRFGKKRKFSPRYIGLYKIIQKIGQVVHELELPQELSTVHLVFHVSMIQKCIGDPYRITPTEDVQVTRDLTYKEVPIAILDRQVKKLKNKEVASVKVLWRNQQIKEVTWEAEESMKLKYPRHFQIEEKDEIA